MRSAWAADPVLAGGRPGHRPRADRGSITAEFAVVLPAVLLVIGLAVGAILLATHRLVLTQSAAELARQEARGDSAAAAAQLDRLGVGVTVMRSRDGPLHCVALAERPGAGMLAFVEIVVRGCAAVSETAER